MITDFKCLVNVKANFNFAIHQSKTFVMILLNTFDGSSLMLFKKQWCWVMLIVCSILLNWRLSKTWVKHYITAKIPLPDLYHSTQSSNKKIWFVPGTRKLRMFFVVFCSFPYRVCTVYDTFYALKFKLEMKSIMLQMKNSKISRLITMQSPVCFCF